jgi:hypothetical protein
MLSLSGLKRTRTIGSSIALLGSTLLVLAACGDKRDAGISDSIHVAGGALDAPPDTSALRETPGMLPPAGATPNVAPPPSTGYYPPPQYGTQPYGGPPPVTAYEPPAPRQPLPSPALESHQPPPPSYASPEPQQQRAGAHSDSTRAQGTQPRTNDEARRIAIPAESLRAAPRSNAPDVPRPATTIPEPSRTQQGSETTPSPSSPPKPAAEPPAEREPEVTPRLQPDSVS